MPATPAGLPQPPDANDAAAFQALLDVSLTALTLLRPLYAPGTGELTDFAFDYLNPAGQRMLRLPERPETSFLTSFPHARDTGAFAFYRQVFETGVAGTFAVNYQADGLDNYFQVAASRQGPQLSASFSDTAAQPRTAVEVALRESQAREQQARAEAEAGRQRLHDILTQLPAQVAVNRGPAHVYELVNPRYQQLFPARVVLGRPVREALPELEGQGFYELLDQVYQTGEPFYGYEMPAEVDCAGAGRLEQRYFNVFFQALRDAQGRVDGLLNFAHDVTPQVLARREAEQLSQALEARVLERAEALRHAQAESVVAAQRLLRVTESLPSTSFTTDQTGQVLYISPQWYAYTGMAPDAPINDVWPTLIHPDDLPAVAREFGAALAEGRTWGYEFRLRGADGRYRWFASQGVPEPLAEAEAAGRVRQWFGSNLDINDLKQAQQAQQDQEQLLARILSSVPAAVATFAGPEHRYTFFNDTHQRLFGGRAWLGGSISEIYPEVVPQGFVSLLDEVYTTGRPFVGTDVPATVEVDGQTRQFYIDFVYQPMPDAQGQRAGILAFAADVTERVRARLQNEAMQAELLAAAQRQAQEREAFHEIFEQTTALVALLRAPSHRYEYANPAYQALFAGRRLVGLDVAVAVPEMRGQGFVALLDRVYQTGETHYGTDTPFTPTPVAGQPARPAYYNFTYQAYREDGQVAGISIFAYDVTEQVLARQQREAERQQLHDLFEQAPVAISILRGADYVVEVANPLVAQLWGRTPAELLGRPVFEALPEARDQGFRELLDGVRQSGEAFVAEGVPAQLQRGDTVQTVYLNYVYQPLRDADGVVTGVAAVATDVTAQVQAGQQVQALNAELTAANRQLTRTNADLDTFVYTASHDLKTPVANIEGLLLALQDELPPAARQAGVVQPLLDRMQEAVERFQRTIAQLTDVARLQQAQAQPAAVVDLATLVADLRLDMAPELAATGTRLTLDVAACPQVSFAPQHLRSIVYNLLSNAVKYRHPARPPHVQLRSRSTAALVVLEVEDNGLGLSEGQQGQLFGLFRRLHDHVEGTGVGLYTVKRLVENAGGTIAVQSTPGVGSTFTVTLPRAASQGEQEEK